MSLWTPSGEHRVGDERSGSAPTAGKRPGTADPGTADPGTADPGTADPGDIAALRRQLADAPADVVVANHCYGLFELAALHLSSTPPGLQHARLAIDALGFLVDGLGERLGEAHPGLSDALAQIRLAYVQISAAGEQAGAGNGSGSGA
ncbi:MAG: hypothetical protein ACRDXC_00185 [Acidimicrobiales bacterium]